MEIHLVNPKYASTHNKDHRKIDVQIYKNPTRKRSVGWHKIRGKHKENKNLAQNQLERKALHKYGER